MENQENIFSISIEYVQLEAERIINRRLTVDELQKVKKSIEWGLLTDIETVFEAAIKAALD